MDQILTGIFSVKSPKGKGLWNQYINLKKIRDRIIHLKSNDTKSTNPEVKTIWTELLDTKSPNWAVESKKIIDHYYANKNNRPRWLKKIFI